MDTPKASGEFYEISGWDVEGRAFAEISRVEPFGKIHRAYLRSAPCFGDVIVLRKAGTSGAAPRPVPCIILQVEWRGEEHQFELKIADLASHEARMLEARKRTNKYARPLARAK